MFTRLRFGYNALVLEDYSEMLKTAFDISDVKGIQYITEKMIKFGARAVELGKKLGKTESVEAIEQTVVEAVSEASSIEDNVIEQHTPTYSSTRDMFRNL